MHAYHWHLSLYVYVQVQKDDGDVSEIVRESLNLTVLQIVAVD